MTIESVDPVQPVIRIDGEPYSINIKEYESFINQCGKFMLVDRHSLESMAQIISDQLLDCADEHTTMEELRPQLKFLRELGYLLKGLVTPVIYPDQGQD